MKGLGTILGGAVAAALLASASPALAARVAWVIPNKAIVRSGPGRNHERVGALPRGTKVTVLAFRDKWCRCKLPSGTVGWIAEWLLEFNASRGRKLAAAAAEAAAKPAWVRGSAVNVRAGPGTKYKSHGTLAKGTKVYIVGYNGRWRKCRTPGGFGWIRGDLLETNPEIGRRLAGGKASGSGAAPSAKGFINGTNVRLREKPSTSSNIIATLTKGQTVYVVDRVGDWYRLRVHGGAAGWVHASLVKLLGSEGGSNKGRAASLPRPRPDFPSPKLTANPLRVLPSKKPIEVEAWTAGDDVNVRSGPGLGTAVKKRLAKGTRVVVTGVYGHWVYARLPDGSKGWIAGWLLNYTNPRQCHVSDEAGETYPVRVGWVARPEVNVRVGPGLEYADAAEAALGTKFIVLGKRGQWYRVALENGAVGWVASWLVDTREQRLARQRRLAMAASGRVQRPSGVSEALAAAAGLGAKIVRYAMQFLGYPYVRGGESPSGFDCSGFVKYVMRQFGISVSHDSRALYRQGRPVSRDELRPGDVVFFKNTYRRGISHVGIYIGNGKFIHASTRKTGVRISSLSKPYYVKRYVGARRMY